jgi:hypothetical protein
MAKNDLKKLHIDLPQHWATGGESLWAEELGDDLYKIRNVPFFAYGLNFYDVVRATPDNPDLKPEIREVVEPNGHKTLRVHFEKIVAKNRQLELLTALNEHHAYHERANDTHVAIDIEPEGSYSVVYDQLQEWEESGLLSFETCEAREKDSFDNVLEDS